MAPPLTPGDYLMTSTFPTVDGVAKNSVQWKWAFHVTAPTDGGALSIAVGKFYNIVPTGDSRPMSDFMSDQLSRGASAVTHKLYNITGALGVGEFHGTPIAMYTDTLGPGPGDTTDLPHQCSLVLATNADPGSLLEHGPTEISPSTESAIDQGAPETHTARSRPLSRSRGRMFLGPWSSIALEGGSDNVAGALRLIACHAAVDLIANAVALNASWSVWSKVDAQLRPIVHGYCETKFGTQRRRREILSPRIPF